MPWTVLAPSNLYSLMKKRVLEVIYGFGYGGIRAFIMNYLQYIKDDFDVDIYVFGWDTSPFTEEVHKLGANIFFEPENNATHNIPKFISQLRKHIREHGPYDVVHSHTNLISAWPLLAARLEGVPVRLAHSHSTVHFSKSIVQRVYSYLRLFLINRIATGKLACGQLAGETMYRTKDNFEIIANGISVDRFIHRNESAINELRESLNIPENAKVYANVTRLDTPKNHVFAVEIFNEIHKLDPEAIFVYGGVVPKIASTVKDVEAKIHQYQLEPFCRYTGPLKNIENLYHLSDIWIYCSAFEGLPFGPIELQAASVPVLASDVITDEIDLGLGIVHFLSLNDSPQKWAELAVSINKERIQESAIINAFKKHNFDIRDSVKKLESIYENYR